MPHPVVDAAFAQLEREWDDDRAHEAFINVAQSEHALDLAAALYRRKAGDDRAARALARIALLAAHVQANAPREPLRGLRLVHGVATAIALFVVVVVAVLAWRLVLTH
jgi:hypothetical protein